MTAENTTSTTDRRLLPTTSCSPSSFAETFEDLHEIRGVKVWTLARCNGDPVIDELRAARSRVESSLKTLSACTANARKEEARYEIGNYLEDLLEVLEDEGMDAMDMHWFRRSARRVLDCVEEAEETDDDEFPWPEEPTWKTFRALSKALGDHAAALGHLADCEKRAKPSPVNA